MIVHELKNAFSVAKPLFNVYFDLKIELFESYNDCSYQYKFQSRQNLILLSVNLWGHPRFGPFWVLKALSSKPLIYLMVSLHFRIQSHDVISATVESQGPGS